MKVRKSWIWIISILVFLLLVTWFIPDEYSVESKKIVDADLDEIHKNIVDFHTWQHWAIENGEKLDSIAEVNYTGEIGKANHSMILEIDGENKMVYSIDSLASDFISYNFNSSKGSNDIYSQIFLKRISDEQTEVRWVIEGNLGYKPMLKIINLFIGVNKRLTLKMNDSLDRLELFLKKE